MSSTHRIILQFSAILFSVILLSCSGESNSDYRNHAVYGQDLKNSWPTCYVLEGENSLNVRSSPSLHKKSKKGIRQDNVAFQLSPGDTIFVSNSPATISEDGTTWLEFSINDRKLYASKKYLVSIPNPNYITNDESVNAVMLSGLISYIPICAPWLLSVLTILIFAVTFLVVTPDKRSFKGEIRETTNMRPFFVFSKYPYIFVFGLFVRFIISFVISVLLFLLLGGSIWVLLWVAKILLWALIIIGWICLVVGILGVFGATALVPLAIVGGIIVYFQDELETFGQECVATGDAFFEALNIFDFAWSLVQDYWQMALVLSAAPLAIFVALALIILVVAGALILFEKTTTSFYNIKHPCPFCHNPSEPALYLSKGRVLPIPLKPGVYGLLHVKHPDTGEEMPTTLLNGRDKLKRRCPHCDRIISYESGRERHIAFIGLPESGKTCLTYRFIGDLMRNHPGISFTDDINKEAKRIILDIKNGKEQDLASKTSVNDMRRSIQLLVPAKTPMPYHFFINDVGGELFTTSGVESRYVQFFKDVDSISILVDPFTMDFSDYDIGVEFSKWYDKNVKDKNVSSKTEKMSNVLQTIKSMTDQFAHKSSSIHMNVVLVKVDTGYFSDIRDDENAIRNFVNTQLGLAAEIADLESTYASLHFYAVSALKNKGIENFTSGVLNELNVKLD